MRDILGSYASYFNRKYGYTGRLWQGRFYSTVLDAYHFWAAIRYIERNAVRVRIVKKAEEYERSSAAAHCGNKIDALLTPLPEIPSYIGNWLLWLEEDDGEQMNRIRNATKTGHPCGSRLFVEELERILGRKISQGRVGRPRELSEGMGGQESQNDLFHAEWLKK
jgi:putative transposase